MPAAAPLDTPLCLPAGRYRTLAVAGIAHALHDGLSDLIYVLLPVWRTEFAASYGMLALLRGLYAGTTAGLQVVAGGAADRFGARPMLVLGTLLAAGGYVLAGFAGSFAGLALALAVSGSGASVQHPVGSAAVSRAYGDRARGPLGIYNFCGDLGKAGLPAAASLLLMVFPWRGTVRLMACLGFAAALLVGLLMPAAGHPEPASRPLESPRPGTGRGGFPLLLGIGVLDSTVRMGFLTFLPFILKGKGAALPIVGLALALVFMGGALGKFACGWLGARFGVLGTVIATEGGTTAVILAVLALPLAPALALLPLLGVMLNGTSSVLYGTVPELSPPDQVARSFAKFYTGTIGSGAVAPVFLGWFGDAAGIVWATAVTASIALVTIPLAICLAPRLR